MAAHRSPEPEQHPHSTTLDYTQLALPYQKKPKRLKKDGTPYKPRKGWGPYRSIPNERAVAFNLQLDVQHLQQEIHNITALRDILRTKTLLQRDSPDGSFVRVVNEFYRVFRQGIPQHESGRKRLADGQPLDQRAFLYSVMDAEVDAGCGLLGPDVMMSQMTNYSTFLRFLCYQMKSFDVVQADDSVVITTKATLRFQILRETIQMVFPHVMGNEWLVAQLVDQVVEPDMEVAFYFNPDGKCCKFELDLDFVGAFASIVKDPAVVEKLLSRALIADNCMLGVIDKALQPHAEEERAAPPTAMSFSPQPHEVPASSIPDDSPREPLDVDVDCLQAVEGYYRAFAKGYQRPGSDDPSAALQRDLLLHKFVSTKPSGDLTSAEFVAERWRPLSACFDVLGFHQKTVVSIDCNHQANTCSIHSSARYSLRITPTTIAAVFPHVATHPQLCQALVGEVMAIPSEISFVFDIDTGRIRRIQERMDFVTSMSRILEDQQDVQFVLSDANLALDGVGNGVETVESSPQPAAGEIKRKNSDPAESTHRTMSISDILG